MSNLPPNQVQNDAAPEPPLPNSEVLKLVEAETSSDKYIKQLQLKIGELDQKLNDEKLMHGQLQEIMYELQGRTSVLYQRSAELGIEKFQSMMAQAKEELDHAKGESEELARKLGVSSKEMFEDINAHSEGFENIRLEFKNTKVLVERELTKDSNAYGELQSIMQNMSTVMMEDINLKDRFDSDIQGFKQLAILEKFLLEEGRQLDEEMQRVSSMLQRAA